MHFMEYTSTQQTIIKSAETLIQKQGYNGFSFRGIAADIGIKTSSIHYHFPKKEDLACAVLIWQQANLSIIFDQLKNDVQLTTEGKILACVRSIISVTYDDESKMCLGGMLASDALSLPKCVIDQSQIFFNAVESWLASVVTDDIKKNQLRTSITAEQFAQHVLLQIEGALLLARLYQDEKYFELVEISVKDYFS